MARLTAKNPYKRELIGLMHSIEKQMNMDMDDIMLVLLELNTKEKIYQFFRWIKERVEGERILAKPNEIVRIACEISDKLDENPM